MRFAMTTSRKPGSAIRVALALAVIAVLAACETPKPAFGECEEGVADLGRTADVAPPC